MKNLHDLLWFVKGVTVYALVGESGTGKSFRAKLLAQSYGIELIIDDGLLIKNDKILAGHSAKKEKTFLAAVRVALFDDKQHRDEIAKALQKLNFKKILILGTSEKMVVKITTRLQLPQPSKILHIEDRPLHPACRVCQRVQKHFRLRQYGLHKKQEQTFLSGLWLLQNF